MPPPIGHSVIVWEHATLPRVPRRLGLAEEGDPYIVDPAGSSIKVTLFVSKIRSNLYKRVPE